MLVIASQMFCSHDFIMAMWYFDLFASIENEVVLL